MRQNVILNGSSMSSLEIKREKAGECVNGFENSFAATSLHNTGLRSHVVLNAGNHIVI